MSVLLPDDAEARCSCRPSPNQLELFDGQRFYIEQPGMRRLNQPPRPGPIDKIGFWHDSSRDVFLGREGPGPLIICPDTSVLIWMTDELDRVEEGIGLVTAPLIGGNWDDPVEAIRDLLHLWQFRDIRFFVSDHYLRDGTLTPERMAVRRRVVDELTVDFSHRGGFAEYPTSADEEDGDSCSGGCPLHPWTRPAFLLQPTRWPHAKDRPLLADALSTGCHVFLTCDKGVLACAPAFARTGLAIMAPGELLERLDMADQLDAIPDWPIDLDAIGRFYGIAVAVEEAA